MDGREIQENSQTEGVIVVAALGITIGISLNLIVESLSLANISIDLPPLFHSYH